MLYIIRNQILKIIKKLLLTVILLFILYILLLFILYMEILGRDMARVFIDSGMFFKGFFGFVFKNFKAHIITADTLYNGN